MLIDVISAVGITMMGVVLIMGAYQFPARDASLNFLNVVGFVALFVLGALLIATGTMGVSEIIMGGG